MKRTGHIASRKNRYRSSSNDLAKNTSPFFPAMVQPRLAMNQPNDEYEIEADTVADKVMNKSAHQVE
jgi:hypothetical protein